MMSKSKPKKAPWIPAPGKTYRNKKISIKTQTEIVESAVCDAKQINQRLDNLRLEPDSLGALPFDESIPVEVSIHLHAVKLEMGLLSNHFRALKHVTHFLTRYFSSQESCDPSVGELLSKVNDLVRDFVFNLDDLEYAVALVENALVEGGNKEYYLKMVKLKERLLCNLLECYSAIVLVFQILLEKRRFSHTADERRDRLQQTQIEELEEKCTSQEVIITNLEKRLRVLQSKVDSLEEYKSSLEEKSKGLHKQLSHKETQILNLNAELRRALCRENVSENEKLLEIIEDLKKNAQSEKTALKKALKIQKSEIEKLLHSMEKYKEDLAEKDKLLQEAVLQRDDLKIRLTLDKNSVIEGRVQVEDLKKKNSALRDELAQKDDAFKLEMKKVYDSLSESESKFSQVLEEKLRLENELVDLQTKLHEAQKEIEMKSKQRHGSHNPPSGPGSGEINELISLLRDTKRNFDNLTLHGKGDEPVEPILRNEIQDLKDSEIRKWKLLHERAITENEALRLQLKELEEDIARRERAPFTAGNDDRSLQMELRLKNEENWRLKQRERDLVNQLEEVREKLQKKEIEQFRFFSLEEELKAKKNELSLLEKRREEECDRYMKRIRELQDSLDKTIAENESLTRYVDTLKTSCLNVFGDI